MRVLHVIPYFAPAFSYGGPPRSVLGLCKAEQQAGAQVQVYTTTANGGDHDLPAEISSLSSYDGVAVRYYARVFPRQFFRSPELAEAIRQSVHTFDLVHIHGIWNWAEWSAARECRRRQVPYVISPRGMLERAARHHRSFRKRLVFPLIEVRNLRGAALLHAGSKQEMDTLTSLFPDKRAVLLPNAVDGITDVASLRGGFRTKHGLDAEVPIVTWLGRVHPMKRLDLLAAAFKRVCGELDARLVIAGPVELGYRQEIEPVLSEVAERVIWMGEVDDEAKSELLADSNLLVLCSHSESFGMSVVEAMAAGCPVVVTRTCPWEEVEAAQCGHWVASDSKSIASAILDILRNPLRVAEMGRNAQALVSARYTWSSVANSMLKYYEQVLTIDGQLTRA